METEFTAKSNQTPEVSSE